MSGWSGRRAGLGGVHVGGSAAAATEQADPGRAPGATKGLLCLSARFFHLRGTEPDSPADTSNASMLEPLAT